MDTTSFFRDLAVIMVMAGAVAAVFTRLGWPKVIGYILAGTVLGKYTFGGSVLINPTSIDVLGQIGVVFLMFTLGLEFSVRKLKKVGHVIFPTALLDMVVMIWAGHFVGTKILGWNSVQSFFLGAAISDSATTLLAKTINEMGWGARRFTKYIFGITITEDIMCIGVIALLTGLVQSGSMDLRAMAVSMGGLGLFLTCVSVAGLLVVPRVMNWVGRLRDDESLLLTMLGFCFLVSYIADRLNFSLALGAFLVGVMGAESQPLKRIMNQCGPLRTMFSAIFFVTIGLMIDPVQMAENWGPILGITLLVVVGKTVNCTIGSLLTGQDLKNALQTGIGLAQIGEFAYLVALTGMTMKAVDSSLYQIAVGVSVATTILNPFLLRASDPLADWAEKRLPVRWREGLETYMNWTERFYHAKAPGTKVKAFRLNMTLIVLQLVFVAAIYIAAGMLAQLDFSRFPPVIETHKKMLLWGAACLLTVPNALYLIHRSRSLGGLVADVMIPEKVSETQWAQSFKRLLKLFFAVAGVGVLFVETAMLSGTIMPEKGWERAVVSVVLLLVAVFGWKAFRRMGVDSLETLRGVLTKETDADPAGSAAELLDVHTEHVKVAPAALAVGRSLAELNLRAQVGVSVIGIERAGRTIVNPTANDRIVAGDTVLLLGDDEEIAQARRFFR